MELALAFYESHDQLVSNSWYVQFSFGKGIDVSSLNGSTRHWYTAFQLASSRPGINGRFVYESHVG